MTLLTSALSIPKEITQFFAEYLRQIQAILPDRVYGCYLYGSVSLGAYDPMNSDLDFMIVLSHALNDDEIVMISHIHAQIRNALPLIKYLDGFFVPLAVIQQQQVAASFPYFRDGKYLGMHRIMTLYWFFSGDDGLLQSALLQPIALALYPYLFLNPYPP